MLLQEYYCLFTVCFLSISLSASALKVGEECIMKATGERGVCRIHTDCPNAKEEAKRGVLPTICGYYLLIEAIVCCDVAEFTPSNKLNTNSPKPPIPDSSSGVIYYPDDKFGSPNDDQDFLGDFIGKAEEECGKYYATPGNVVQVVPLLPDAPVTNITIPRCLTQHNYNSVPLIVGGSTAGSDEFPFMAALGFSVEDNWEWRCGGTLISHKFVLSAAHCTFSSDAGKPQIIRLGGEDIKDSKKVSVTYQIRRLIIHPNYNPPQKYNDIALIESKEYISFSQHVRAACLYARNPIEQRIGIAAGWGRTEFGAPENSETLMKVNINLYETSICDRSYPANEHNLLRGIDETMICAGDLGGGKDTCLGDSGGPLLIRSQCAFSLIGVTSFGKACGQINTPAVYTKVSKYLEWIVRNVWP